MTNDEIENPIEDLNDFLKRITDIRKAIESQEGDEPDSQKFFFRGQANSDWDVVPGVFRNNYLAIESQMLNSAFLRNPTDFRLLDTDFEKLAKLQHYGLPTRLLDVTSNPLVALYFACQPHSELNEASGEFCETDGVVYFQRAYGKGCNDFEISIISHLANIEIDGETTLSKILEDLVEKKVYTRKAADDCKNNKYRSLIDVLQGSYFVISNLNNERLIRQSGAFLLVGKYNITINNGDIGNSIVQPAIGSVKGEFRQDGFIIPAEKKTAILEELDFYNVNEGSLFPELEHQMTYIKNLQSNKSLPTVGAFSRIDVLSATEAKIPPLEQDVSDEHMTEIIEKAITETVSSDSIEDYKTSITKNLSVDWYRKESVLSKMRVALAEAFCANEFDKETAKKNAAMIVTKLAAAINELNKNIR